MIVALAFITSYVRRAANEGLKNSDSLIISIHTLRTEDGHQHRRDVVAHLHISIHALSRRRDHRRQRFYPHPPCGGRPARRSCHVAFSLFLSTPSMRRATAKVHKILLTFAAQARKCAPLTLQYMFCIAMSKHFRAVAYTFRKISRCEDYRIFLSSLYSHQITTTAAHRPVSTEDNVQYAPPYFYTNFPDSKIADCQIPGQSTDAALP